MLTRKLGLATDSALGPGTPLGSQSIWRLAALPSRNAVAIADANTYRLCMFDTGTNTLITSGRIPLQIMPVALAARPDDQVVYALNLVSNSVNVIDLAILTATTPSFTVEPPVTLAAYRTQMLTAFTDLTSVLGQYFKDAWCNLFLVDCPVCTEKDKLYLGVVEIRSHKVFNISNFPKRRYAKSFRTWGYWLSSVPILPLIKELFAKLASTTLVP